MRVGIAWHGAAGNSADVHRSIPAECLSELKDIVGVTWVNLQFGPGEATTARAWLGKTFEDGTKDCQDALDSAAILKGLDLVITVDTLTLHLAGSLGVPTWALHRFCREWRWGDEGEANPWYPSVRNFTVPSPGAWRELLREIRIRLLSLVNLSPARAGLDGQSVTAPDGAVP